MDVETTDNIIFDDVKLSNKQALKRRTGVHEFPLLLASRDGEAFTLRAALALDR